MLVGTLVGMLVGTLVGMFVGMFVENHGGAYEQWYEQPQLYPNPVRQSRVLMILQGVGFITRRPRWAAQVQHTWWCGSAGVMEGVMEGVHVALLLVEC